MSLTRLGKTYEQWDLQAGMARSNNDILMHITSELGEAFTCIRKFKVPLYFSGHSTDAAPKPEGLGPELADVIILAAKLAAYNNIDIDEMIRLKHNFNLTRLPNKGA